MKNELNLEELLRNLNKLYETEEDKYTQEILDDIDAWFEDEREKEEYLRNKFKGEKHFEFEPFEFDK
jgi:hypothetical protein